MERGTGMKKIHETMLRYSQWALIPDLVDQSIFCYQRREVGGSSGLQASEPE